jgi:hypothetical protein
MPDRMGGATPDVPNADQPEHTLFLFDAPKHPKTLRSQLCSA